MHKKSSSAVLPETLYSPEAEQSVLGGLMLDNDRWDEVAPLLQAEDFCSRAHQEIWKKMRRPVSDKQPDRFNHPQ